MLQMQGGHSIVVCTYLHEKSWRCSTIKLILSSQSHTHSTHFLSEFDWYEVFSRDETWNFLLRHFLALS